MLYSAMYKRYIQIGLRAQLSSNDIAFNDMDIKIRMIGAELPGSRRLDFMSYH